MPYISATCPNCKGNLKLSTDMEKGYCVHCGSIISLSDAVKEVSINKPLELKGYESFNTLYKQIQEDLSAGNNQSEKFRQMLNRALELDPDNEYLYDLILSQIWKAQMKDGVFILYEGTASKVLVPEGITTINKMAFASCPNLKEVVLPKSLEFVMPDAFIYESMLTITAYSGTYAAKYAMHSPAKLNLIDAESETAKAISDIESIIKELNMFKTQTIENIERCFIVGEFVDESIPIFDKNFEYILFNSL